MRGQSHVSDATAKRVYDRAYDFGVQDAPTGHMRHSNPWKRPKWGGGCHYYWQMGYEDGLSGHTRRVSESEAMAQRIGELEAENARLREIALAVAEGRVFFETVRGTVMLPEHSAQWVDRARAVLGLEAAKEPAA